MIRIVKRDTYSWKQEPIVNMKSLPVILLAVACQAYTPITGRSWVKFRRVKDPAYETVPLHGEPDIFHAKNILIEERISTLSTMIQKSVHDFHNQLKKYTADITECIKRPCPKQIMDLLGNPSYDINTECCLTTTARSSLG